MVRPSIAAPSSSLLKEAFFDSTNRLSLTVKFVRMLYCRTGRAHESLFDHFKRLRALSRGVNFRRDFDAD